MSLEGSERILLAEDDESVRLLIQAVLTYRGYAVTPACDGEEGVKLFREKGPFDLVILDRAMPKAGRQGRLEKIQGLDPDVPSPGPERPVAGTRAADPRPAPRMDSMPG